MQPLSLLRAGLRFMIAALTALVLAVASVLLIALLFDAVWGGPAGADCTPATMTAFFWTVTLLLTAASGFFAYAADRLIVRIFGSGSAQKASIALGIVVAVAVGVGINAAGLGAFC